MSWSVSPCHGRPDLRSAAAAADFFSRLRAILVALGVNDGNLEEGSLRCDANVSVRPAGRTELGVKAEIKNLNSFRFVQVIDVGTHDDLVRRCAHYRFLLGGDLAGDPAGAAPDGAADPAPLVDPPARDAPVGSGTPGPKDSTTSV